MVEENRANGSECLPASFPYQILISFPLSLTVNPFSFSPLRITAPSFNFSFYSVWIRLFLLSLSLILFLLVEDFLFSLEGFPLSLKDALLKLDSYGLPVLDWRC